jgi:hypothetical protein
LFFEYYLLIFFCLSMFIIFHDVFTTPLVLQVQVFLLWSYAIFPSLVFSIYF